MLAQLMVEWDEASTLDKTHHTEFLVQKYKNSVISGGFNVLLIRRGLADYSSVCVSGAAVVDLVGIPRSFTKKRPT